MVPKHHTHLNLQLSAAGLFKYLCPFVTTQHERVFLVVVLSESISRPVSNDWSPVSPLCWFGSYEQVRNNSHKD